VKESIKSAILNRRMLICVFTGFTSGLPLYILIQLVPAWLTVSHVGVKEIGLFALIGIPYTWKFMWAPFMDAYSPPLLGRRRGWMFITQLLLLFSIIALGNLHPEQSLMGVVWLTTAIAFFSASQDVVLDAYRRELLPDLELGLGNSIHVQAYRIAGLIPGSLGFILADHIAWPGVFIVVASFMGVGLLLTLFISEAVATPRKPISLQEAIIEPFKDYFVRLGKVTGILILLFMLLYKIGDSMATAMSTTFYIQTGFTLTEIGTVAKFCALVPAIAGGFLGGILMIKMGINRALWFFGAFQWVAILGFALLSMMGNKIWFLGIVVSLEYLAIGLGTAAFTAFIARTTNPAFAATQFALLTALAAVPRTFVNATTGFLVDYMGWTHFFLLCMLLAVPGMLLLLKVAPWNDEPAISTDP